jgi:hypothetical protein
MRAKQVVVLWGGAVKGLTKLLRRLILDIRIIALNDPPLGASEHTM